LSRRNLPSINTLLQVPILVRFPLENAVVEHLRISLFQEQVTPFRRLTIRIPKLWLLRVCIYVSSRPFSCFDCSMPQVAPACSSCHGSIPRSLAAEYSWIDMCVLRAFIHLHS
jgi:hypothetical protein